MRQEKFYSHRIQNLKLIIRKSRNQSTQLMHENNAFHEEYTRLHLVRKSPHHLRKMHQQRTRPGRRICSAGEIKKMIIAMNRGTTSFRGNR